MLFPPLLLAVPPRLPRRLASLPSRFCRLLEADDSQPRRCRRCGASSSSVRSGVRFSSGGAGSGGSKQRRREGEGTEGQGGGSGGAEAGRPLISDGNGSGGGRGATWQIHSAPPLQLACERLGTRLTAGSERKGARPSHPHPCDMPGLWSDGARYSAPPRARAAASYYFYARGGCARARDPSFPLPVCRPTDFFFVVLYRNPVRDRTGKKLNKLWLLHRSAVGAGLGHVVLVEGGGRALIWLRCL